MGVVCQIPNRFDEATFRGAPFDDSQAASVSHAEVEHRLIVRSRRDPRRAEMLALDIVGKGDVRQPRIEEPLVRLTDHRPGEPVTDEVPVGAVAKNESIVLIEECERILDALDSAGESIGEDLGRHLHPPASCAILSAFAMLQG
jgi:hypothetical protein